MLILFHKSSLFIKQYWRGRESLKSVAIASFKVIDMCHSCQIGKFRVATQPKHVKSYNNGNQVKLPEEQNRL